MSRARIESILIFLKSGDIDVGWTAFLESYSDVVKGVISRFETDERAAEDCFEFICAKLSDDNFRRLKSFTPDGQAKFRTWLTIVTANLCKDWRRSIYGRKRLPQSIRELPEFDQLVFECIYRRSLTHHECVHVLKSRFAGITLEQVSDSNAQFHSILTSKQRWQISVKRGDMLSIDESVANIESSDSGPEFLVQSAEDRLRLNIAMARLEPNKRLLLQLRYQQDLTLKEVAQLTGLADPFKARRQIDVALAALAKAMKI